MNKDKRSGRVMQEEDTSIDKGQRQIRRNLLAAIATAGAAKEALPGKWNRPIIDTVLLPAHANMSPSPMVCMETSSIDGFRIDTPSPSGPLPFTGTVGQIPGMTVTPAGTSAQVRWFYTIIADIGGSTSIVDSNSCQTVTRGAASYTIPLAVPLLCAFLESGGELG